MDSFVFYRSFYEALKTIENTEERMAALDCLVAYALDGTQPDQATLTQSQRLFLILTKPQIDANQKRRANGAKGGRPSLRHPTQSQPPAQQDQAPLYVPQDVLDNLRQTSD